MKIFINEIPEQGLEAEDNISPEKLNLDTRQVHFTSPVRVQCFAIKDKDILNVKCKLTSKVRETCSRCLSDFDMEMSKSLNLHYELKGEHAVELDDDIKDTIVLDYPMKILCRKDCKGLCPHCGKNLNEGPCSC